MKTRLIVAGAVLPVLFVVLFFLKPIFFGTLAAITCAIAAYEFMRVVRDNEPLPIAATRETEQVMYDNAKKNEYNNIPLSNFSPLDVMIKNKRAARLDISVKVKTPFPSVFCVYGFCTIF